MKKKLNLLLVSKSLPNSFKGGIQTHVWALSKWLQMQGHEVTILSGGEAWKSEYTEKKEGRKIIRIPFFPGRRMPFLKLSIEEFAFSFAAYKWMKAHAHKYDIVHIQGRSGAWIPLSKQFKVVATYHGLIKMEIQQKLSFRNIDLWLHAKLARWLEQLPFKRAHAIIYVSYEIQKRIATVYGKPLQPQQVIYNGIDRDTPEITPDPNSKTLIFVGRLHPVKGTSDLIKAIPMVDPGISCILIGDGPMKNELNQLIDKLQLRKRVQILGSLSHEKVMEHICKSYALILPSYYETQGIVLMEANIQSIPVLASNISGIKEVVRDNYNGLLFEPGNSQEIADKINYLFSHPEEARRMGSCGKQYVIDKFHWSRIAKDTISLYYHTLNEVPQQELTTEVYS